MADNLPLAKAVEAALTEGSVHYLVRVADGRVEAVVPACLLDVDWNSVSTVGWEDDGPSRWCQKCRNFAADQ